MSEKSFWLAEPPPSTTRHSIPIYACDDEGRYTADWRRALRFESEAACRAWCDAHPSPAYVPVEHGMMGP